jgi:OFA family oxalate/formate antiporter-like MFS transporter
MQLPEPKSYFTRERGNAIRRIRFPKIFFGWWTVLATCLLTIWGTGYYALGFSALFKPISAELGLSRAATSVARSLGHLWGGFEAPAVGWLVDRIGPKTIILCGTALMGLGLVLMMPVNSLWTFYVVWGVVVSTGMNVSSQVPVEKAISNWFVRKRGRALSFRQISFALATILVVPLISWLTIEVGWRMACATGGVVMWLGGLPLIWFFVRKERPEYYGLLPDGATTKEELAPDKSQMVARGVEYAARSQEFEFTVRQSFRTPALWLLICGYVGFHMAIVVISTHCIPLLTDMGFSPVRAAGVVSTAVAINIPIRFAAGYLADRFRKEHLRFLTGGVFLLPAAAIVFFLLRQSMVTVHVFLVFFYMGQGLGMILHSMMRSRYFGRKGLGSIHGISQMITMPFVMAAPIYAGWVYDTTGSYLGAFKIFAGLLALGAVLIFCARSPQPPAEVGDIRKFF